MCGRIVSGLTNVFKNNVIGEKICRRIVTGPDKCVEVWCRGSQMVLKNSVNSDKTF